MQKDIFNWDLFLDLIANNQIIPVIGSDLMLIKKDDVIIPLYDYLTQRLGEKLNIDTGPFNFREFVLENKSKAFFDTAIRTAFDEILEEQNIITDHLIKLARITGFSFYISTTFDNIFESVLREERLLQNQDIVVIDYSYPLRARAYSDDIYLDNEVPVVYNVLGSLDSKTCAITDEEILEYIYSLKNENRFANTLYDAVDGKNLLFLGCNFPNWLLRFFIRIITNERFVMSTTEKIIADNYAHKDDKLVLFLEHFKTQVLQLSENEFENPIKLIDQLYAKWLTFKDTKIPKKYEGSVFLSFSHKDVNIIRKVRDEMVANGIDVWFDEKKLTSGDNYDRIIKEKIKNCNIFIPFISASSISNKDSYVYDVEWDMAMARRKVRESDGYLKSFIHPVIIDDTNVTEVNIPQVFRQLTIEPLNVENLIDNVKQNLNLISHDG